MFNIGDIVICIKEKEQFLHDSIGIVINTECINVGECYTISYIGHDDYLEQYFILKEKEFKYHPSYFETLQENRNRKINKLKKKLEKKYFLKWKIISSLITYVKNII